MFTPESIIYHKLGHTKSGSHKFQSRNKKIFQNKWVNSGRIDPFIKSKRLEVPKVENILVNRRTASGDVLVSTAIASALKNKYLNSNIWFCTSHPEIVANHPHISGSLKKENINKDIDLYINLDLAYESRPKINILDAYCNVAGVKREDCDFTINKKIVPNLPKNYLVIHAGYESNWVGRNWTQFSVIGKELVKLGYEIICVGAKKDFHIPYSLDFVDKTKIDELAYIIENANLFIGVDSFPMHVAQFTNTPGICFFGSIDPKTRIYRSNMTPVVAKNLACLGCHNKSISPSTVTNACKNENKNEECVSKVSVGLMFEAIKDKLRSL